MRVVVAERDGGGAAVADAEVGAEQQEEAERGLGADQEKFALLVGCDGEPRSGLRGFRNRQVDAWRGAAGALEPQQEAPCEFRVGGSRVLREVPPAVDGEAESRGVQFFGPLRPRRVDDRL